MLVTLCQGLIKNTKYEKYIRFFTGFLIMLSLLKPLIDFSQNKDALDAAFIKNVFQNELAVIEGNEELNEMKQNIKEEYEIAYENQIAAFADHLGLTVTDIKIRRKGDEAALEECQIRVKDTGEDSLKSKMESLKRKLKEVYNLEQDNIDIDIGE